MRTVDAIRTLEEIPISVTEGYGYNELPQDGGMSVYPLTLLLNRHYVESPFFMKRKPDTPVSHMESLQNGQARIFVAKHGETVCAYVKIERDGETFIGNNPKYLHISGAFCLPEHRGKGVYANLINYTIRTLKAEGYTYLGVDFESLNPSAWGFWLKYFHAYTYGLVRRIDEHVME